MTLSSGGVLLPVEEVRHQASLRSISVTGASFENHVSYLPSNFISPLRFVRMASDDSSTNRTVVFADPPSSTNYVSAQVPIRDLNEEIMDIAFVKVVDSFNYPGGIGALMKDHRFDDGGVNLGDHWKHKYLVDMDGMGYSGRFFSFLESDSAVMKATVYKEFFEGWIQPW